MGDAFAIFKQLQFFGIELIGVTDGIRSSDPNAKINFGIRAVLNEHFIDNLRLKTHRGLEGQVLKDRCAGGRLFGYRSVPVSEDPNDGMKRVIFEPEAEVVREMFALAKEGKSTRAILDHLVKKSAPCPDPGKRSTRRKGWCYSSVRFILRNPHYAGRVEWNRRRGVKSPFTGKKTDRPRSTEEVVHRVVPPVAIVSEQLFDEVQAVVSARSKEFARSKSGQLQGRKAGTTYSSALLTGILKCAQCGGSMGLVGGKVDPNTGQAYRQ